MEQPMLAVNHASGSTVKVTAHLLPCRVHHDGPVGLAAAAAYWAPQTDSDGKKIAYFRGRELHGKALKVPSGYRGVVVEKQQPQEPQPLKGPGADVVDVGVEDEELPLGALETKAEFNEAVIWGHEAMADISSDPYLRAVDEWIDMAAQIHSYEEKS